MSRMPAPTRGRVRLGVALLVLAATCVLLPTPSASAAPPVVQFTATLDDTNRITLAWTVTGGDSSNLLYLYEDIGFKAQDCTPGTPNACSHTLRVTSGGVYRYTLSVKNNAGEYTNVTREVTVTPPTRPTVPSGRVHVDMLNPQPQTLSWTHPGPVDPDRSYVTLTPPGGFYPLATEFALTGSYTVPVDKLATWNVRYCTRAGAGQTALCSAGAPVTYVVEPAQIEGPYRRFVATNQAVTLSWAGSGNMWHVASPSLGLSQWTTTPSITIPATAVVSGVHDITLVSCIFGGACSNRVDLKAPTAGTVHHLLGNAQSNFFSPNVAEITPDSGGPVQTISAEPGTYYHSVAEGAHVNTGDLVGLLMTGRGDSTQLVVGTGPSIVAFTNRSITTDFTVQRHDTGMRPTTGSGLDITIDSAGDVWQVGEFGTAAAKVQNGVLSAVEAPTARILNPNTSRFEKTKPFVNSFGGAPTNISALVERVIDTGSAIWFVQAGSSGVHNHSRLIRFDRTGTDNPATPDDDRLCAVHVPGDNNHVVGLAHDPATQRIWFSEKGPSGQPPSISWFVDGSLPCNNDLAYQQWTVQNGANVEVPNEAAINAAADANLCDASQTTNCIHRIPLTTTVGEIGHLTVDATSNSLWIVSWTGSHVSRFPLNGDDATDLVSYPLPTRVRSSWFGGFPWQIRTDASAVYLNEYGDNQLLRLDKAKTNNQAFNCTTLTAGANPCISEVFLPMAGAQVNSHSIALRNGKLWFTMSAESLGADSGTSGSYVGYVDTASWASGSPTGVIYDDLAALGPPSQGDHWGLRGIEVAANGKVALAEMRREILILNPN